MADFPVVPLESIEAQFNIDMIGRNRDDNPSEASTVYVIGADRISTELHAVVAQLNMDMIGRNRDDKPEEANTVYLVGSERISTELHNVGEDANAGMPEPLTVDYEMNDPADPEGIYFRSDHYSYAAKGIPIAFFFTGTHPDYHRPSDSVEKILFPKLQRIAQMVYEAGFAVASREKPLVRDNLGPRTGKGHNGKIVK